MSADPADSTNPEQEILECLDRKDYRQALVLLMEAHGRAIYRYCRRVLGDGDQAADVHQTVFIQAYRDLDRYSRGSSLRTWIYAIARHRCLDAIKKQRRWGARFSLVGDSPERSADSPRAYEQLAHNDEVLALERCLQKLKPETRIAVLLRYQEDHTYPEIARICRERPATLQARVSRALIALRRCINESEHNQ